MCICLEPTHMMYWNKKALFFLIHINPAWTDTYDVLKLAIMQKLRVKRGTWTDTYDVLKRSTESPKSWRICLEPTHMMYWNNLPLTLPWTYKILEPTHMMYWNLKVFKGFWCRRALEPTHMMYWNHFSPYRKNKLRTWTDTYDVLKPGKHGKSAKFSESWTDTYDVLKHIVCVMVEVCKFLEPTHMMYWNEMESWPQ